MSMIEEWRPVSGHEGLYEVSNLGRVKSLDRELPDKNGILKRFQGKVLKNILKKNLHGSYMIVRLPKTGGGHSNRYVAHLVLEAFDCPRPNGMECCHCDGNSLNNNIDNLRWGTPKENSNDKYEHGTILWGSKNHQAKLAEHQVIEIRGKYTCHPSGTASYRELANQYGVPTQLIGRIVRRERWRHI
jgi:hypothetical protein